MGIHPTFFGRGHVTIRQVLKEAQTKGEIAKIYVTWTVPKRIQMQITIWKEYILQSKMRRQKRNLLLIKSKFHVLHWFYKLKLSRRLLWAVKKWYIYTTKLGFIKIRHSATLLNKAIYLSCKVCCKFANKTERLCKNTLTSMQHWKYNHLEAKRQIKWQQISVLQSKNTKYTWFSPFSERVRTLMWQLVLLIGESDFRL